MADIVVFNELSEDISVELHELTELLSISDSSDSIVVIWDISSQMELNEVTKSTNSAHVKLLLWLVTVSILSVTVSIEDVIVCSLEILSLIMAWVKVVLCDSDVEVDSEVEVYVTDGVSVSLNVWDGDDVIELDVEKEVIVEDCKVDKDVRLGVVEAVIDCELDVDILAVVESRVVGISGVVGGNIVEDEVSNTDGDVIVLMVVDILVNVDEAEGVVGILIGFSGVLWKMVE